LADPVAVAKVPAAHGAQAAAPAFEGWKVPAPHGTHSEAAGAEYCPAAHAMHAVVGSERPATPALPKRPALQPTHMVVP
jgi:hypothetical protein